MGLTSQFQISHLVNQQILRLQIAMKDPVRMAVVKTLDELIGEFLQATPHVYQQVSQQIW